MATAFVSPGVFVREIDQSLYVRQLSDTSLGVVGTASWGPVNEPQLITSVNQLLNTFGPPLGLDTSNAYGTAVHPMINTVMRYLRKGRRAWVVRVEGSGSNSAVEANVDLYAIAGSGSGPSIAVNAKHGGTYGNQIRLRISNGTITGRKKLTVYLGSPNDAAVLQQVETFDNLKKTNEAATATTSTDVDSWLTKINGVSAYIEVAQGGDITNQPDNVNQSEPASAGLQDASDLTNSADQLDTNDTFYSFANGADGVGQVSDSDFIGTPTGGPNGQPSGLHCFDNAEAFVVNVLAVPGAQKHFNSTEHIRPGHTSAIVNALQSVCLIRQDSMALVDPPIALTPTQVAHWHNGDFNLDGTDESAAFNSNLLALHYPWVQVFDEFTGTNVYLPPSAFVAEAIANTDFVSDPWFAPAGLNRARIEAAIKAERTLTQGERDFLYSGGNVINPIATFQGTGLVIWGQRTMQRQATALDRINVRRMLLILRKLIATACQSLVFEPNDATLWRRFRGLVSPFLEAVQNRRGITQFRVICDETTNTPDVIEQNQMIGKIFIQPTKTAEILVIDFVLTPQGAQFQEIVQSLGGSV